MKVQALKLRVANQPPNATSLQDDNAAQFAQMYIETTAGRIFNEVEIIASKGGSYGSTAARKVVGAIQERARDGHIDASEARASAKELNALGKEDARVAYDLLYYSQKAGGGLFSSDTTLLEKLARAQFGHGGSAFTAQERQAVFNHMAQDLSGVQIARIQKAYQKVAPEFSFVPKAVLIQHIRHVQTIQKFVAEGLKNYASPDTKLQYVKAMGDSWADSDPISVQSQSEYSRFRTGAGFVREAEGRAVRDVLLSMTDGAATFDKGIAALSQNDLSQIIASGDASILLKAGAMKGVSAESKLTLMAAAFVAAEASNALSRSELGAIAKILDGDTTQLGGANNLMNLMNYSDEASRRSILTAFFAELAGFAAKDGRINGLRPEEIIGRLHGKIKFGDNLHTLKTQELAEAARYRSQKNNAMNTLGYLVGSLDAASQTLSGNAKAQAEFISDIIKYSGTIAKVEGLFGSAKKTADYAKDAAGYGGIKATILDVLERLNGAQNAREIADALYNASFVYRLNEQGVVELGGEYKGAPQDAFDSGYNRIAVHKR